MNEGLKFLQKAAENGDAQAQYDLAHAYFLGVEVKKNEKLAYQWVVKSALQGNPLAQIALANFYLDGEIVEQDVSKSIYWWNRCARGYKD